MSEPRINADLKIGETDNTLRTVMWDSQRLLYRMTRTLYNSDGHPSWYKIFQLDGYDYQYTTRSLLFYVGSKFGNELGFGIYKISYYNGQVWTYKLCGNISNDNIKAIRPSGQTKKFGDIGIYVNIRDWYRPVECCILSNINNGDGSCWSGIFDGTGIVDSLPSGSTYNF